jgi:hypothetical protein
MILIHKETAEIYELHSCQFAPYLIAYDSKGYLREHLSEDFEILGWL